MPEVMAVNDLVLAQGMDQTRAALRRFNDRPWRTLAPWVALSMGIAVLILAAVGLVASLVTADPTVYRLPGINTPSTSGDYAHLLYRNSLVLALHAMACVAGFMAGSSMPQVAAGLTGVNRWVHEKAGPLAIGFVTCATLFSLTTQAFILGSIASDTASQLDISPAVLMVGLLPHALPELTALFLPLAAWIIASRRGEWDSLLAATAVTVSVAIPVVLAAAAIELWVSPHLLIALSGH